MKKLVDALKVCIDELYMIHSQYGDKEHARNHSVALVMAEESLLDDNLEPSLGDACDGSPMNLDWFIASLSQLAKPLDINETGAIRIYQLSRFVNNLKAKKWDIMGTMGTTKNDMICKNRFGVNVEYFHYELTKLTNSLMNRPHHELAQYLRTLAKCAEPE